MSRRPLAAAACAIASLAAPGVASAAEYEVIATYPNVFRPQNMVVNPGDAVRFRNAYPDPMSPHNVKFDDGSFEEPAEPSSSGWRTSPKAFPNSGVFRYYCEAHGGPGGSGMSGTITVQSSSGGGGGGGNQGPTLLPPPIVESLRASQARRRSLLVRINASYGSLATIKVRRKTGRRYRLVRTIRKQVGSRSTRIKVRRRRDRPFAPGRYRVSAQLKDTEGQQKGVTGPVRNTSVAVR